MSGKYDMDEYELHDDEWRAHKRDGICDRDCMGANNCGGHGTCTHCGKVVCGCELDENGLCEDCADERERHTCRECGEFEWDLEIGDDGLCAECRKEAEK